MGRSGCVGTNLSAKMVVVARICRQKWFWELEFLWIETVLGARTGFFLESVTSWVLAFDRSGDRTRNPSGTPDH